MSLYDFQGANTSITAVMLKIDRVCTGLEDPSEDLWRSPVAHGHPTELTSLSDGDSQWPSGQSGREVRAVRRIPGAVYSRWGWRGANAVAVLDSKIIITCSCGTPVIYCRQRQPGYCTSSFVHGRCAQRHYRRIISHLSSCLYFPPGEKGRIRSVIKQPVQVLNSKHPAKCE